MAGHDLFQIVDKQEAQGVPVTKKYVEFAMKDPATIRHLIDRILPPAKQEIGITSNVGITLSDYKPHGDR